MNENDNFEEQPGEFQVDVEKWQSLWDAASSRFETIPTQNSNVDDDYVSDPIRYKSESDMELLAEDGDIHWRELYERGMNINEVFKRKNKKKVVKEEFLPNSNPITLASRGMDQKVRVTPNFTDGDAIRDLSRIKMELESLERKCHSAQVLEDGKSDNIQKQIDSLRIKMEELSNKLTPSIEDDNT